MTVAPMHPARTTGRIVVTVLPAVLLVLAGSPAIAGGWWTYPRLDTEPMSPGERVTASATVMFPSSAEAGAAETSGEYFAYLVRGIDQEALQRAMSRPQPEGWWTAPEETVMLGQLGFGETDTNLRHASATFVVPDIESGAYSLMFCTRGCEEPLGDVIPFEGVYVGDPAGVRLLRESRETNRQVLRTFDDIRAGIQRTHRSVGGVGERVDELDSRAGEIARSVDGVELSMGMLRQRVDELEAGAGPATGWPASTGWFLAGLALAAAWSNRRRNAADRHAPGDPDERHHLVGGEVDPDSPAPEFVTSF